MIRKTCRRVGKCVGRAWAYPYLGRSKKMGCLKLPYYEKEDRPNFLGLWKKSESSKSCDNYYPFGLTFNSYSRENSVPNKFKFQEQEHIDDLGLNWDSFKWRNHQPDIGRFFNIDPLAEKYVYNSPYAFSENQVVAHREFFLRRDSVMKSKQVPLFLSPQSLASDSAANAY
jgi:RHS repeat-associated protein